MYTTIGTLFEQTVRKYPRKEALVDASRKRRWTYKQWEEDANRLANALTAAGIEKGDIVSTFLYNSSELAMTFIACAKLGAVFNPINFRLKSNELTYILNDAKPKVFIFEKAVEEQITSLPEKYPSTSFWSTDNDSLPFGHFYYDLINNASTLPPRVQVNENDLYAIMYTSGTTGRPKGVMHKHRDMVEQSLICINAMKLTPNDRGLSAAPMFHCAELHCCFLPRIHIGASNVILHHFDPQLILETIQNEKVTVLFGAPTMWNMILQEDVSSYKIDHLRKGLYGAAPMAPALVRASREKLGIDLIQAYGMTEMGPAVAFLYEDEQLTKAGSSGKACLNHEIKIVAPGGNGNPDEEQVPGQVGEIIVKGTCLMSGYYNRETETKQAIKGDWYYSGDLGYMDEEGYLYVADRVDDMIISGGENIYPREVEDLLYEHEGVLDVAVLGQPDEKWGEQVVAVVVPKNDSITKTELDYFCKDSPSLADYKRPRKYIFVNELPRNASGKIQKFKIREDFSDSKSANIS
ncbi:fatty acid--CoA ligase [Pseudalkalibacillus caeni]|uniref:Fatty acid--CoA ligase n=1 Tax=Exobacillus caeni TaxID=2574798 RepID=A0A5R9EW27_9BACL|nr:fatty acid--CoA ligase [Pseudalkalibacillus caeni]TLS35442.1 fatty acid--CoA ligase [Pseudalkalibacillus caeni]